MQFYARVVPPPPPLTGSDGTAAVDASTVDVPQLAECGISPLASVALVFVEPLTQEHGEPTMPDDAHAAPLYWRIVSTDSCEACHTGVLLTLRNLDYQRGVRVCATAADGTPDPIVFYGMLNAERTAPFVRHVMTPRAGCHVDAARGTRPRVRLAEPARPAAYGGCMHQLVYLRTLSGAEYVLDFTGPQYGIDDRLPSTRTPR